MNPPRPSPHPHLLHRATQSSLSPQHLPRATRPISLPTTFPSSYPSVHIPTPSSSRYPLPSLYPPSTSSTIPNLFDCPHLSPVHDAGISLYPPSTSPTSPTSPGNFLRLIFRPSTTPAYLWAHNLSLYEQTVEGYTSLGRHTVSISWIGEGVGWSRNCLLLYYCPVVIVLFFEFTLVLVLISILRLILDEHNLRMSLRPNRNVRWVINQSAGNYGGRWPATHRLASSRVPVYSVRLLLPLSLRLLNCH
ncbi:hypothetical protein BC835DRAFT_678728 [Cytidiella melzeri]|nr:hypothetical protein BC835DRAFT_678728 [Cytidiella melzeri]